MHKLARSVSHGLIALLTILMPIGALDAQSSSQPDSDVRQFQILGVAIGMDPASVRAELSRRGFQIGADNTDTMGFDYALQSAMHDRNPAHQMRQSRTRIRSMNGRTSTNLSVMVEFIDMPDGASAGRISLSVTDRSADKSHMRADVMRRYGNPTVARDSLGSAWWCRRTETACSRVGHTDTTLEYSEVDQQILILDDVNRLNRERTAYILREVERVYPNKRPVFQ